MKNHYLHYLGEVMAHQWSDAALTDYGEEKTYTFGELATEMERLHVLFRHLGIHEGDKVLLRGATVPIGWWHIWRCHPTKG